MPARWSADSVLALAPDDSSRRAAGALARPAPWTGAGATDDLVWGLCAGSGKNPYQTIVDLGGPAYKCSCPSRKFPCKHALGLLLLWAAGTVPDQTAPADFAQTWRESRTPREPKARATVWTEEAGARNERLTTREDGGLSAPEASGTSRASGRTQRVADGLADLREWLRDQVRVGLAVTAGADLIAARMVDAQAPGVAGTLRGLSGLARSATPGAADEWPARLLGEYAMLHLLARAHERLDTLPEELAAVVRARVGYTTGRREVLARPAVTDHWLVLATRDLPEATVPGRRIWLRARDTGRWAMLLTYAPNGAWQDPGTARLRPGTELHADVHFYPGQPQLRALTGERHAGPARAKPPESPGGIDALLAEWAAGLEQDPWLTTWPVLLTGTPVPAAAPGDRWYLTDQAGNALPLASRESLWTLLAISGGHPVTVAGEWHPDGLLALTAWHGDRAVPL